MTDYLLILKKELMDIVRDKRSFITLFIPVLIFPLMYMLMGSQMKNDNVQQNIPCIVHCADDESYDLYTSLFEGSGLIEKKNIEKSPEEDLKNGAVACILRFENNTVTVQYNSNSTRWLRAAQNVYTFISVACNQSAEEKLNSEYNTDFQSLQAFQIGSFEDINQGTDSAGSSVMASIAPMLLVMIIMSGGVSVAVDLFTGEKEKGTFESLLTTQVSRTAMLMAKFTAVLIISLSGMVLSILAYVISFACSDSAMVMMTGGADIDASGIHISAVQIFQLLAVCITLSIFAVSLMTLLGLHAKTVKEAQSQMSLITIFPTLLSGLTMFMDSADISVTSTWIPIFNTIVSIKMIFLGTVQPVHIAFTSLSLLVYSAVMWLICIRMLNSEKLLRG